MQNLNLNKKVLKLKDWGNISFKVEVNDDDLVIDVKRNLSKKISKHYKNIFLLFKNEILFDDKLISDYTIESNQFVLWLQGKNCARYSKDDSDTIKCINIIDNYKNHVYFVNMNKKSTVQMLKSIISKKSELNEKQFYLEFDKNNISIDDLKSLELLGLGDGCCINLFHNNIKVRIADKYENEYRQIFECDFNKFSTVGQLKQICAEKTNIEFNEIYLKFNEICLLDDEVTLMECGLSDGCIIELVNSNIIQLNILECLNRGTCVIYVNKFSTVGKLKPLIREKMQIRYWEDIVLAFNRLEILDDDILDECEIDNGDTLMLPFEDIPAGGGIWYDVKVIPLTDGYASFMVRNVVDLNDVIAKISAKTRFGDSIIDNSLINLYSDANKIFQVRNDSEFQDLLNNDLNSYEIEIYYEIISKLAEFEIIEKLGEGSFGKVYKYKYKNTNQIFALKQFDLSTDSLIKEKFQIEVDCYLRLKSHIRIIKYENHFINENKSYIVMEYMERGSLGYFVKHNDLLSEPRIAKYARQILEGLEYLHYNRILHRDLKGDNILLNEMDDLKLCDFGLAKILTDISSRDFLNGVVPSLEGTLNWMSPEIINGEPCGPASDIWSFGCTMVEIITRKYPHEGLAIGKIFENILVGQVKFDYPANSSNDMKSFISSCLKRNPKERANIKDLYQCCFVKNSL